MLPCQTSEVAVTMVKGGSWVIHLEKGTNIGLTFTLFSLIHLQDTSLFPHKRFSIMYVTYIIGRCSVVDFNGRTLCDIYARPEEPIVDYRTRYSGIRPRHMKTAIPLESARRIVKRIIKVSEKANTRMIHTSE